MSKSTDQVWGTYTSLAMLWMTAKYYLMFGVGYLFARDPKTGLRVSYSILRYWLPQQIADARFIGGVIWREWARPVIVKDAKKLYGAGKNIGGSVVAESVAVGRQQAAWGTIGVTAGANVLLLGMGGGLVESIDNAYQYLEEKFGWDSPFDPSGGLAV